MPLKRDSLSLSLSLSLKCPSPLIEAEKRWRNEFPQKGAARVRRSDKVERAAVIPNKYALCFERERERERTATGEQASGVLRYVQPLHGLFKLGLGNFSPNPIFDPL